MQSLPLKTSRSYIHFAVSYKTLRFYGFLFAVIIYALTGSPTPDHPGLSEVLTGSLILYAAGFTGLKRLFDFTSPVPIWFHTGRVFLFYCLVVPVLSGVIAGHPVNALLRDILPFLFICMPLFIGDLLIDNRKFCIIYISALVFLGVSFAARSFLQFYDDLFSAFSIGTRELTYFANAPTLLFSALLCAGFGVYHFGFSNRVAGFIQSALYCLLSLILFLPIIITLQRASVGFGILYVFVIMALVFIYKPKQMLFLGMLIIAAILPFGDVIFPSFDALIIKTANVGTNNRFNEAAAVQNAISDTPFTAIFGIGWGASFHSPAVGEVRVHFTHSLLTTYLLKTGVLGAFLMVFYMGSLFVVWARTLLHTSFSNIRMIVILLAFIGPFLIDTLLYASFKSLDFGLLLLLVPVFITLDRQKIKSN